MREEDRKIVDGKRLVRLFCQPHTEKDGTVVRHTKRTHPEEWKRFVAYAAGDIVTMREAHRKMPTWNYRTGKQVDLCLLDWKINARGFAVDRGLAEAAVRVAATEKGNLADQVSEATDGRVGAATQRDELLAYILAEHGVELPDMQSDTLERRLDDPDLPEHVKELLRIRLQASRNTAAKFRALLKRVNTDGRLRGCMQFRGASRTGRWAHRAFQPGNLMRPTMSAEMIALAVETIKDGSVDLIFSNVMEAIGNTVRGAIVAPPGRKLVVADLSNIEGRMAAWLAGEQWKLDAFRAFDEGEGHDLYIVAYAKSFNVDPASVPKKGPERQIGKVEELMFQYGGGVGAWITGAATYGIDLVKMTEQVFPSLPAWAIDEATDFCRWIENEAAKKVKPREGEEFPARECIDAAIEKARFGLLPKVFIACDAIKRLWRKAHPQISSYWGELEEAVRYCIENPGETLTARKVKVRRDGAWLRIMLPSGRYLCYPNPRISKGGDIVFTGLDQYTKKWQDIKLYGGKILEQCTQGASCDQLAEPMLEIEKAGYETVLHVHDELVCETPDTDEFTAERLAAMMCAPLGWNEGLPLAAAGFETKRYTKE
jgi:DNA polymerase